MKFVSYIFVEKCCIVYQHLFVLSSCIFGICSSVFNIFVAVFFNPIFGQVEVYCTLLISTVPLLRSASHCLSSLCGCSDFAQQHLAHICHLIFHQLYNTVYILWILNLLIDTYFQEVEPMILDRKNITTIYCSGKYLR